MSRFIMAYAVFSYLLFLGVSVWMAAFLLDINDIRSSGHLTDWPTAVLVDVSLITLFGLAHSIMARPAFKRFWTRIIPPAAERATYVAQSSVLLAVIFALWHPIPGTIWNVEGIPALLVSCLFGMGLCLIASATILLDHFEFTGLRQAWTHLHDTPQIRPQFRTPSLYSIVRHPLQLGTVIAMFAVPHMTADGLLFASVMLLYIFIGLHFEERALLREFGSDYEEYRRSVPMLLPRFWPKARDASLGNIGQHPLPPKD